MKKAVTGILVLVFILTGYGIYNAFRYKTYYGYTFLLMENGKKYKMNTFNLAGDNYKKEYYIILAKKNEKDFEVFPMEDLENLISIDKGNYDIKDSDSRFYDGIIIFNEDYESISEKVFIDEITINKSIERREIKIDYKGSKMQLVSDSALLDKKLKKTKSILMSAGSGRGGRTYRMIYYGLPVSDLNKKFDLGLNIKIDNKNKIVYFIRGE